MRGCHRHRTQLKCHRGSMLYYSVIGFMLLMLALAHYFSRLKQNKTPKTPVFLIFSMTVGSLLSLWSIGLLINEPTSIVTMSVVVLLGTFTLLISAVFVFFLATKATPIGNIKVSVGEQMLTFKTDNFDSASLLGKRTLLKFYRGSWCPYCSAELMMFEELAPKLTKFNVQIVGISNDTREQQQKHLIRDNISHTLVSDPELKIIRQYGVEHHKALGATEDDTMNLFGITMPIVWKMRYRPMAIPTSMLIDETGKIVWIDQSEDYRLRASEEAVMSAVKTHFA